jgi:hypothetical protein
VLGLCGKQWRCGRPARTKQLVGRGWLRLEAALSLIWRWRGVLKGELADALSGWFRHRCSAEASAARQFRYFAALLASTAFVQTWAEVGPLPYAWHVWRTASVMKVVPRMIGMCLGWALGNAFKATRAADMHMPLGLGPGGP